jgi:uncharacterized membrane protein YccC
MPTPNIAKKADAPDKKSDAPEAKPSQRLIVSVIAAAVAAFIASEPLLFETPRGMQIFQGALVFAFWLLLMFGGASEPNGRS